MIENVEVKELEIIINNYISSDIYKDMLLGDNYYNGKHDILKRKRMGIGIDGERNVIENLPNFKIVDNQFKNYLDQKVNYLLSKNPSIVCENEKYLEEINGLLKEPFFNTLYLLGKDAYKFGIGWLYVYYNELGELEYKKLDSREIIPVWKNNEHEELDYALRLYSYKEFNGSRYEDKTIVELYTLNGIEFYNYSNGKLSKRNENIPYISLGKEKYNWNRIPLIPFKVNENEIPLIKACKSIQDAINEITSDFKNDMEESNRNTIYVIKGYREEAGKFRNNVNQYGVIFLTGEGGNVDTIRVNVNTENYKEILKMLKSVMLENCRGFDAKDDKLNGNPNQMNIQSMYSAIDLDANALEREFKVSFNKLLWFINQHLLLSKRGDYTKEKINIVFNRDILINESQAIEDVIKSMSVLSKESVIAQHPWVEDVQIELDRLKEENQNVLNEDYTEDNHIHNENEE